MVQERDLFFNINLIYNKTLKGLYKQWSAQLFFFVLFKCKKCNQVRAVLKAFYFLCIFLSNIEYEVMWKERRKEKLWLFAVLIAYPAKSADW